MLGRTKKVDVYEKFESSIPFVNTHIESFYIKVQTILEENDNKLTIDAFR